MTRRRARIGFIPLVDAAVLIAARELDFAAAEGVEAVMTAQAAPTVGFGSAIDMRPPDSTRAIKRVLTDAASAIPTAATPLQVRPAKRTTRG